MTVISRRRFLGLLAVGASAVIPGGLYWLLADDSEDSAYWDARRLVERVRELTDDARSMEELGRRYLAERGAVTIQALLASSLPSGEVPSRVADAPASELQEVFSKAARDDFRAGRVVEFDGWILASSELDLCRLMVALDSPTCSPRFCY